MDIFSNLERVSRPLWMIIGIGLLCVVGLVDYATGYEISFSLFYLLPIGLVTWFTDEKIGMIIAVASAGVWLVADIGAGAVYSSPAIYVWNALIRFGFFVMAVFFLRAGKRLDQEKVLARTDSATGAVNTRFFRALAQREIYRCARYRSPITIAFMDIDNFKNINDQFGHLTGDKVLIAVVDCVRRQLRKTDIVARVGGDEFAVLLPEVGPEMARLVIPKMQRMLSVEMLKSMWPVTFSIGVVTFTTAPDSPDDMLSLADSLMYTVKGDCKDDVRYSIYPEEGMERSSAGKRGEEADRSHS